MVVGWPKDRLLHIFMLNATLVLVRGWRQPTCQLEPCMFFF